MKTALSYFFFSVVFFMTTLNAVAQTHIVPPTFATTNGDATFLGPLTGTARTYQLLIHENQLTQMVGARLTGISFRSSTATTTAWPTATAVYNNYDIYLSESVLPVNRSFTFASNIVGVQKKVRFGTLSIPANSYPAGGPSSFGPVITFDSAYAYAGGHLLLEIRHDGNVSEVSRSVNAIGTSNALYSTSLSACWVGSYTGTTTTSQGNAVVVKFDYNVVPTTPVTSVAVATQGNVPATITTNAGTLQMTATVLPAAASQNVTWSIVPGTGTATISAAGLVTAQTNGTVWAKAVSVQDVTKRDSMQVTISNQAIAISSVAVATLGNVPALITTNAGTLQMTANIVPATANQSVTWSIVPGTGTATINTTGLVTAQTNGTVWAKAVSVQDVTKSDSLRLTLSNQTTPITSLTVATQGGVLPTITTNAGTLQMTATILPATANQSVSWSIVPGTGTATINTAGLVTAQTNGTVWAKAVSVQDITKRDSMQVTISNQTTTITSLIVATQGGVPATITSMAGTLQMTATILPVNANQNVTWSIVPGTGTATINTSGLVTAQTDGTVWAKAVSVQDVTKRDSMRVTISNQTVTITSLTVATQGGVPATITTGGGILQMTATVLPAIANQNVTWSIVPGTGAATINASGLVTAQTNGTVWARAVSVQDVTKKDSMRITVSNQFMPITSLRVTTQGSVLAAIRTNAGTLQMAATILPATANQNVTWSIVPGSGTATINTSGLVTAQTNGVVWAKAVSVQDTRWRDSLQINISNQGVGVSNIENNDEIKIFPNPVTNDVLTVNIESGMAARGNIRYTIVDVNGKQVSQGKIKEELTTIRMGNLAAGTYFLHLKGDNINVRRTVVKGN